MSLSPISTVHWISAATRPAELRPIGISLSPGCFQATDAHRQQYNTLIQNRVNALLQDERHYIERRNCQEPMLDPKQWKQVKKEKDLTFYRRRSQRGQSRVDIAQEEEEVELPEIQRAIERGYTTLICDGVVKGTIEDMLYGMTASSQDDLLTGFSFRNPPKDCVWLGTVESATPADPFHTADLIWALPKLPPILDQVDVCYLKATGQALDQDGRRYGYVVLHSVHIAQCPAFEAHGISRSKMYFTCLLREPQPGVLKVTVRGIFDLSKKVRMLTGLVSAATTSLMVGLLNGVGIGEAKKLTLLAHRKKRSTLGDVVRSRRQSVCSLCCKRESFFGRVHLFRAHLSTCYICEATVCSNCTRGRKQRIFLGVTRPCSKVDCCPNCVQDAVTTIHVRPSEPEFQVVAEYYLNHPSSSSSELDALFCSNGMKTNASSNLPTNSTSVESLGEYTLEFEDDPFSVALDLPELRRSSGDSEDNNLELEVDTDEVDSGPEAEAGSIESSITVWLGGRHRISIDDEDFIPHTAPDTTYSDSLYANARLAEKVDERLLELNIRVERPYAQTQEVTLLRQGGGV
uniref:FYVE-type domain-containing protein n=1 Tax=Hyaloperonospora arabidopsidis (strain Emoy2) TaxID=559515 RepID=M4C057_HYAAE